MVRVRSYAAFAGCAVAALSLSAVINCGSSTTVTTASSTSATTSSGTSSSGTLDHPPAAGPTVPGDGPGTTFAISQLFLGDTDPCSPSAGEIQCTGAPDKTSGWTQYGYDLDGQADTATTTNHCQPVDNANRAAFTNGKNGIDNSFGKNILNIILSISSEASSKINQDIAAGKFTVMLDVAKLGTKSAYNPLTTQLFAGGVTATTPKFDGTDNWPVRPELLNPPATAVSDGSQIQFKSSYVTGNTWVSGSPGTVQLALSVSSVTLTLTIQHALLSFQMDPTHKHVTNGIIAGVLATQQLTSEIQMVAGSFSSMLCSGEVVTSVLDQIRQASDIMSDGTQDPSSTCDGISIGLGFNAEVVETPTVVAPKAAIMPNPCATGGSTSASSTAASSSSTSGAGGAGGAGG